MRYLQNHIEVIAQIWPEDEIAFGVIDEVELLAKTVAADQIVTQNDNLKTFVLDSPAPEGRQALYLLLKEAGLTEEQSGFYAKESVPSDLDHIKEVYEKE